MSVNNGIQISVKAMLPDMLMAVQLVHPAMMERLGKETRARDGLLAMRRVEPPALATVARTGRETSVNAGLSSMSMEDVAPPSTKVKDGRLIMVTALFEHKKAGP